MSSYRNAFPKLFRVHFRLIFDYFLLLFILDIVHPDVIPKHIKSKNSKHVDVKEVDVGNQFTNGQEFHVRGRMFQWISMEASKLGFGVLIIRFDNGSHRRLAFVTLRCERSGNDITPLQKFKLDYSSSRKCETYFKLVGYLLENNKWIFNVIINLHNHDMCDNLANHHIARHLMPEKKGIILDRTLNMVQPKNILATLQLKRPENVSNIKQVYNIHVLNNNALQEGRNEIQ